MAFSAKASLALWKRRLAYRERKLKEHRRKAHASGNVDHGEAALIHKWEDNVTEAKKMVTKRRAQVEAARPLHLRAYEEAAALVGVMEQGGNNAGPMVSKIIRANQGTGPEPWCGDFMAYVYRAAGSKAVTRSWAAVRLLGGLAGLKRVKDPQRGDLVRFNFDHVGMFSKWVDRSSGVFETIEGNTGASGAVSDSTTGGDGVYRKQRSMSQVNDFLRVTR